MSNNKAGKQEQTVEKLVRHEERFTRKHQRITAWRVATSLYDCHSDACATYPWFWRKQARSNNVRRTHQHVDSRNGEDESVSARYCRINHA